MKEIFKSDREFNLYHYFTGLGRVVLRSRMLSESDVNVDIVFFNVFYIQLFTHLKGLKIRLVDWNVPDIKYSSVDKLAKSDNYDLFEIESGNEKYYAVGYFVKVFENRFKHGQLDLASENSNDNRLIASSL